MKVLVLYGLAALGIPNILGMVVGLPLGLLLAPIPRLIRPATPLSSPLMVIPLGVGLGIGCGVAGIIIAALFGIQVGWLLPLLSSGWALFYYVVRNQSKFEAVVNVVSILLTWEIYWSWHAH